MMDALRGMSGAFASGLAPGYRSLTARVSRSAAPKCSSCPAGGHRLASPCRRKELT